MSIAPADRGSTRAPVSEALSGVIDDRFEIANILGQGGMCIVYRARDLQSGDTVALKVLRPEIVHPHICARFAREVAMTRGLDHPGVLEVIATGEIRGRPYYVMPFVQGSSLKEKLSDGNALTIEEAVRIGSRIGDALAHAHARGIMHRDIKPANVLLDGDNVVLADFGIARAVDIATAERLTESGVALGTAHYMSPEQASGGKVDLRTDIYSLGCVLYEMLVGAPPFNGATTQQVLARHATSPVPGMREVRGTIAEELETVVLRCLEKLPADRYQTAAEFVEELRVAGAATASRPYQRARNRRKQFWAAVAGAAAIAVVAIVALQGGTRLDPNRILVLPLVTGTGALGSSGEDAATMIVTAIDGVGPIRTVDGWRLLTPDQRANLGNLSSEATHQLAVKTQAGRFVQGRIITSRDSSHVVLQVFETFSDTPLATGKDSASADEAWRASLRALNQVLPQLIGAGAADVSARWQDRSPKAVAAYLQGEAAFRRLRTGEALARFREALAADSLLTLAALRGAQAASWNHVSDQAGQMARVALRHELTPRDAHFARGLLAYTEGNADSASRELQRATRIDPTMALAWLQLGETFTHLLPQAGDVDSIARTALAEAHRLDSTAGPSLYHLAERAAREGNVAVVSAHFAALRVGNPDTIQLRQIELMHRCAAARGERVDWSAEARTRPLPLLSAATKLAAVGGQLGCAAEAFSALLAIDTGQTADADGRRFQSLLGLVSVRHARGQPDSAVAEIDRFTARWGYGSSLLLRQTFVNDQYAARASAIASQDSARFGADFRRVAFSSRLWLLGVWAARNGRTEAAASVARELDRRADSTRRPIERRFAQSVQAHIAMAARDTAAALPLLESLVRGPASGDALQWEESASMADERLLLARILLARGDPQRALDVAHVLDSSQPAVFLMYLVPSLELRAQAARALGDDALAGRFTSRIASIRRGRPQ